MATDLRENGKSRSHRIDIDYHKQTNWLTRSRSILALVAVAMALAYGFYVFALGGPSHLSTGPVAAAHASFESDCQKCHLDFTPISGDALRFASSAALDRLEETCQSCHRVDHHFRSNMKPEFAAIDQHCSACHTDHQGRDHDMVNVASHQCTQCHNDLNAACASASPPTVRANVTAFNLEDHGTFSSLTKGDPGRVKFDHAQHMLPGQVDSDAKGGFTIAMLDPTLREGYRKTIDGAPQTDDSLVTLTCADCHQYAGVPGGNQLTAEKRVGDNEIGRHIAPIVFEKHCAACHAMTTSGQSEETLPLPHGAPWAEIETLIASKVVGGQALGPIRMPRDMVRKTPLVGEGYEGAFKPTEAFKTEADKPADAGTSEENFRTSINESTLLKAAVAAGREAVKQRCIECHDETDITDESIAALRSGQADPLIPQRWLEKGIYDHAAHRKIDCSYCHKQAYPSADHKPGPPNDSEIVMIGGIETCSGCHRKADSSVPDSLTSDEVVRLLGGQSNWGSDACIECHRYHWQPPAPRSLDEPAPTDQEPTKPAPTEPAQDGIALHAEPLQP